MRKPIVAGQFYPAEIKGLNAFLNNCKTILPKKAYGAISPHAGYFFSGQTSMKAISSIDYDVDTIIILGPNHNGIGQDIAISKQDWITPYGLMHNDTEFSNKLADNIGSIDETAHVTNIQLKLSCQYYNTY